MGAQHNLNPLQFKAPAQGWAVTANDSDGAALSHAVPDSETSTGIAYFGKAGDAVSFVSKHNPAYRFNPDANDEAGGYEPAKVDRYNLHQVQNGSFDPKHSEQWRPGTGQVK